MKRIAFVYFYAALSFNCFSQSGSSASSSEMSFPSILLKNCFGLAKGGEVEPRIEIVQIKQGYGYYELGQSINKDPITIGSQKYAHGIGTHANSELLVKLPYKAKSFKADVGYDGGGLAKNNAMNRIVFSVVSNGKVLWKSTPLFIGSPVASVNVPLNGVTEFTLKVESVNTDVNWTHANWANPLVELENGKIEMLDNNLPRFLHGFPFSFMLNKENSRVLLQAWKKTNKDSIAAGKVIHTIKWSKPDGSFEIKCLAIEFKNHSAVEWKLSFKNTGTSNSPVLKNVKALDLRIANQNTGSTTLHYNRGSDNNQYDFMPIDQTIETKKPIHIETRGGRSSETFLPFWNLECPGKGIVAAIGWSGDWKADFAQPDNTTSMSAGMSTIETYLKPGEEISSPTICLLYWEGSEAIRGSNLFRRYMKDMVVPKWYDKEPLVLAVMGGASTLEGVTEQRLTSTIKAVNGTGADIFWVDAGWYGNGPDGKWWTGRGNWYPEKTKFPNGMRPVSDEVHKNGMKFMLWYEPEAVCVGTEIDVKHPEFVIKKKDNKDAGLFNLGNPEGWKYITDMISKSLIDWDVDVFRNDYNLDPGPFWALADEPGRKGMTEIRYVEGFYKFWDALLARKPNLLIDNCASGGRRIDYETCKRSIPMWRSDYECGAHDDMYEASQNESYGLNMYLPYNSTGYGITGDKYKERSISNGNVALGLYGNYKNGDPILFYLGMESDLPAPYTVSPQKVKSVFDDLKKYNYLMSGDFYPLTDFSLTDKVWMAVQYDNPEKGEGVFLCFRRKKSFFIEAEFSLKNIDTKATYKLLNIDTGKETIVKGEELSKLTLRLNKEESAVIKYTKQ
jgi:alpha-galactosidase